MVGKREFNWFYNRKFKSLEEISKLSTILKIKMIFNFSQFESI